MRPGEDQFLLIMNISKLRKKSFIKYSPGFNVTKTFFLRLTRRVSWGMYYKLFYDLAHIEIVFVVDVIHCYLGLISADKARSLPMEWSL